MEKETFTAPDSYEDKRLDKAILSLIPALSFSEVQKLLRKKFILLNGKKASAKTHLKTGDEINYPTFLLAKEMPERPNKKTEALARFFEENTLFEDAYFLALNKPAGLAVQGGTKTGRHLDGMLKNYYADDAAIIPCLTHRLDLPTSGVILIAKNPHSASKFAALFAEKKNIQKHYIAECHGYLPSKRLTITHRLKKKTLAQMEQVMIDDRGQDAETECQLLKQNKESFWLFATPKTGRKHQIRVHLASLGCPIIGDEKYNKHFMLDKNAPNAKASKEPFSPLFPDRSKQVMLHAYRIIFTHPFTQETITLTAPLPEHMARGEAHLKSIRL